MGDDGGYTGLFMFVADRPGKLSKGTLYAGKWTQTSDVGGGAADLSWIKLGHASDGEIMALVNGGIKFSNIFDVINSDAVPGGYDPAVNEYKLVKTYTGSEWLRLKPGMDKTAAFLETRRYAALLGATTEFNKFEGVTHNAANRKTYVVMSRVEGGMSDGVGDIRLAANKGGAVYELSLSGKVRDSEGKFIKSDYVATTMASIPELLGSYDKDTTTNPAAAWGDYCPQDKVCDGDNLKYSEAMRTLFVGEDTGYRNNNYVWAFNVDTRKLSRILSVPQGAEATGLQAGEDYNGFSYIMGNFQHPGEFGNAATPVEEAAIKAELLNNWGVNGYLLRTAIGYIGTKDGALPAMKYSPGATPAFFLCAWHNAQAAVPGETWDTTGRRYRTEG
jgi:secreted PhoX family phosphatase